ncbi:MAG: 2Fe-2S iron-sulfur cluster-binding protein, partial [Oscillospiraceae bacterium]
MTSFNVNGRIVTPSKNQKLLRFLRDELHLTSVKDGCSEGACGACTVIIDGKTCKSCVPDTDSLAGKNIITVEGLTEWESKVFSFAYAEAGAVQCGFCIPGMVICTKALLDKNLNPTDDEIRYALRNNYCRCTGYVKIFAAVRLAAKIMREGVIPEKSANNWQIGSRVQRVDAEEKTLGRGKYPDDIYLDGMNYGVVLRSKYPRARVISIDTSAAKALDGVVGVYTAEDIPGDNKIGHLKHDQYTLIPVGGLTHYLGDGIAFIVAKDMDTAEKAKKLVKVEYEELPFINGIEAAAAPNAPKVFDEEENNICAYKHISRGNADEAIKNSKHVISHHFETPWTEHAFLEPECAVAFVD